MQQPSIRHFLSVLLALGLGACSAGSDKGATGSGDTAGNGGNGADGGNNGGSNASGGSATAGNATAGNNTAGDGAAGSCYDQDMDSFGLNCAAGPDCDDKNAALGGYEICDGKDNDCDGKEDEFIKDVCAVCDESCVAINEPPNDSGWTPIKDKAPEDVQDVIIDDEGAITLARDETQAHSIWVANTQDLEGDGAYAKVVRGTVSKMDSKTNRELARYLSVRPADVGGLDMGDRAPRPSRTAVDQRFDAYVANRAHEDGNDGQPTITKYANDEKDCIDRNMNGMIDTSRDISGDGKISLTPIDGEFLGADDECILWTKPVGAKNSVARALAVGIAAPDADVGDLYVGLYGAQQVCRLNADTGETFKCTDSPGFRSYGAASDAKGRIWFVSRDSGANDIGFLDGDTWTQITNPQPCGSRNDPNPYGMSVDADSRVYIAMANCDTEHLFRYDHDNGAVWSKVSVPLGGTGRGVAADQTSIWVAISGDGRDNYEGESNRIEQFDIATLTHVATHRMPNGQTPVGVGVSFDGSIWAINRTHGDANDPFTDDVGIATRLDLTVAPDAAGRWIEWPVGRAPYTYSDFIGFGLNTFADPKGFYRFVLEGCIGQVTHWRGIEVKADVPASTSVKIRVRTAGTKADLEKAAWQGPFDVDPKDPTIKLTTVEGAVLEVEVALATDDQSVAPRVFGVEAINECETIIE